MRRAFRQQAGQQGLHLGAEGRRLGARQAGQHRLSETVLQRRIGRQRHHQVGVGKFHHIVRHAELDRATKRFRIRVRIGRRREGIFHHHRRGIVVAGRAAQRAQQHAPDKVIALLRHSAMRTGQYHADAGVAVAAFDGALHGRRHQHDVAHHAQPAQPVRRGDFQPQQGVAGFFHQQLPQMAELVGHGQRVARQAVAFVESGFGKQFLGVDAGLGQARLDAAHQMQCRRVGHDCTSAGKCGAG